MVQLFDEKDLGGKFLGSHRQRMLFLLTKFAGMGKSLDEISGPRYLGRATSTLKRYCRLWKLSFPDYQPRELRPPKPAKKRSRDKAK